LTMVKDLFDTAGAGNNVHSPCGGVPHSPALVMPRLVMAVQIAST